MIGAEHFLGYARIDLQCINFEHKIKETQRRRESKKNVNHLLGIFQRLGCKNDEEEHAVIAVVEDESALHAGLEELEQAELPRSLGTDVDVPILEVPVHGIQGLHRIAAGKKYLKGPNRWWLVRLYSRNLSRSDTKQLAILYSHEQPETDGDILCKILIHKGQPEEAIWNARLTPTKRKDLKQLLRDAGFLVKFRRLTKIPILWTPLELGSLHRLLTLRCHEEIYNGLDHVYDAWTAFLRGLPDATPDRFDAESIAFIEGLAPASSDSDRDLIEKEMTTGKLFPRVKAAAHRKTLLENLLGYPYMIPTIKFIFEGLKQLEPACEVLKKFIGQSSRSTIRSGFFGAYENTEAAPVELGERHWRKGTWQTEEARREFLYIQQWVRALRNFYYMTDFTPRKEVGKAKPEIKQASPFLEFQLGRLAMRSGFKTETAMEWNQRDVSKEWTQRLCCDMEIGLGEIDDATRAQIAMSLPKRRTASPGKDVRLLGTEAYPKDRRNGRPYEDDYFGDRQSYFLYPLLRKNTNDDRLSAEDAEEYRTERPYFITSLFARRDLLFCFFGHNIVDHLPSHIDDDPYDDDDDDDGGGGGGGGDDVDVDGDGNDGIASRDESGGAGGGIDESSNSVSDTPMPDADTAASEAELQSARMQLEQAQKELSRLNAELVRVRDEASATELARSEMDSKNKELQRQIDDLAKQWREAESKFAQDLKIVTSSRDTEVAKAMSLLEEERNKLKAERERELKQRSVTIGQQPLSAGERNKGKKDATAPPKSPQQRPSTPEVRAGHDFTARYTPYSQELIQHIGTIMRASSATQLSPQGLRKFPGGYGIYTLNFELANGEWYCFTDLINGTVLPYLFEILQTPEGFEWQISAVEILGSNKVIPPPTSLDELQEAAKNHGSLWISQLVRDAYSNDNTDGSWWPVEGRKRVKRNDGLARSTFPLLAYENTPSPVEDTEAETAVTASPSKRKRTDSDG
ncbi:uncharacterized protein PV09_07582 [Verruconis gallopava]|uniref:Uncharacterized protein n=1 Tax=Verruconis gallopava TaxID=253628 RepID=A0A0D2ANW6_9PEZI|nr:uncharacterized protein PV09_07582 [Verruconis gallopava]KIW00819.1 hypothetical protein PV09_07582 [Verruconis gallopava]